MTAPFRLDDRVALVTGAASGIGAATARVFAEAGADVVAGGYSRDPHDVEPTRTALENAGRRCLVADVDVADNASVDALVAHAIDELREIAAEAGAEGVALLCFEDVTKGEFCHRRLLAGWLTEQTGLVVPELNGTPAQPR
jgi:NAD(P)-dependent dehydrogenase (short-subunit alcohol dehydrogenase family)